MSITEKAPQPADATPGTDQGDTGATPQEPQGRGPRRWRRTVAVGAGLIVALAGSMVLARTNGGISSSSHLADAAPPAAAETGALTMPAQLAGLNRLPTGADPTRARKWQSDAVVAAHGTPLVAQGYGTPGAHRSLRAVVARTDLTGSLELAWAADAGHAAGTGHCTQNVRLVPQGQAGVRPTIMLCWRTSATLSAYVLVIDPRATLADADAAPALDQLWNSASQH